jgi:hypothetical protein
MAVISAASGAFCDSRDASAIVPDASAARPTAAPHAASVARNERRRVGLFAMFIFPLPIGRSCLSIASALRRPRESGRPTPPQICRAPALAGTRSR